MHLPRLRLLLLASAALGACSTGSDSGVASTQPGQTASARPQIEVAEQASPAVPRGLVRMRVEVVDRRPHATDAYTQGLLYREGLVYESTGSYGKSSLRRWRWVDGEMERTIALTPDLFGEGLADLGSSLVQLTWRRGLAIYYDPDTLRETGRQRYRGEGWGLAYDGEALIQSDGTHRLRFRDPQSFDVLRELDVRRAGAPQGRLNELEFVDGLIYGNVYQTDEIVAIEPATGEVVAVIDASDLLEPEELPGTDVLNGIAHRPETGTFLLTGKYWPWVFEVEFVEADAAAVERASRPSGKGLPQAGGG